MQKLTMLEHATSPETPDGPAPGFPAESWQEWPTPASRTTSVRPPC